MKPVETFYYFDLRATNELTLLTNDFLHPLVHRDCLNRAQLNL